MTTPQEIYLFVDRVEGGAAVLLAEAPGDGQITLPALSLPPGVREGDYLRVRLAPDEAKRTHVRGEIERLMQELGDNP